MDEFEKRLKQDADAVKADVSPALRERIDASLRGVEQIRPAQSTRGPTSAGLWLASSLTGLAAVLMIIVLVNWNRPLPVDAPVDPVADLTVPAAPATSDAPEGLDIRTADFASPLEEELTRLRSDLEKARDTVAEDLGFTF